MQSNTTTQSDGFWEHPYNVEYGNQNEGRFSAYYQNYPPLEQTSQYPQDQGFHLLHQFYTENTGLAKAYGQRPPAVAKLTYTPASGASGLQMLFKETENLKYTTQDGKAPSAPIPLVDDPRIARYNLYGTDPYKEKCGCGNVRLPF